MHKHVLILLLLAGLAGCDFTAKPAMRTQIEQSAARATAYLATSQPASAARAYVQGDGLALRQYYDGATLNLFAYLFDAKKMIYTTAKVYLQLNQQGMDASATANQAATTADVIVTQEAVIEANEIVNVRKWLTGAK